MKMSTEVVDKLSKDDRTFLQHMRDMHETDLMKSIIVLLFEKLGFQYVRYMHGPQERGKDIAYCERDAFGTLRLKVAQVKNTPFDGKATSNDNAHGVLRQLDQCLDLEVLNPATNIKERPCEVVLVTTYPLHDYQVADGATFLQILRSRNVVILPPERLVQLVRTHLSEVYYDKIAPNQIITTTLKTHLNTHLEYSAFKCEKPRSIESFVVNLSLSPGVPLLANLFKEGTEDILALFRRYQEVDPPIFANVVSGCLALPKGVLTRPLIWTSKTTAGKREDWFLDDRLDLWEMYTKHELKSVTVVKPDLNSFLTAAKDALEAPVHSDGSKLCVRLSLAMQLEEVLRHLYHVGVSSRSGMESSSDTNNEFRKWNMSSPQKALENYERVLDSAVFNDFKDVKPIDLASIENDTFITGVAGAGKTTLARSLAMAYLTNGRNAIYFPCMRLEDGPLNEQIVRYLMSLHQSVDAETAKRYLATCDLFVFDGLDETRIAPESAMAFIISSITGLSQKYGPSAEFESLEPPAIPPDLQDSVVIKPSKAVRTASDPQHYKMHLTRRLTNNEVGRLRVINSDSGFLGALETLLQKVSSPRIMITCRSSEKFSVPPCFIRMDLQPMSDEQLFLFFKNWLSGTDRNAADLIEYLNKNSRLKTVCRTPIVATLLVTLFEHGFDLPRTKTEVYELRHRLLFGEWDASKGIGNRNRIREREKLHCLSRLALDMHKRKSRLFDFQTFSRWWEQGFAGGLVSVTAQEVLEELIRLNGIVFPEPNEMYSFGHLSFQEHLAALGVMWSQEKKLLVREYTDSWWYEVLIFYSGLTGDCSELLESISEASGLPANQELVGEMEEEGVYTRRDLVDFLKDFKDAEYDDDDYDDLVVTDDDFDSVDDPF